MPSVGEGRALKLVLRPGHRGPKELYAQSWPLSGGGGTPRRASCPPTGWEARRAVCSVGPSRPHPHSGLRSRTWSRGAAGVCGVGLENWPLLLAESLCSLVLSLPRAWDPWMDGAGFKPLLLCPGTSARSQRCPRLEGSHLRTHGRAALHHIGYVQRCLDATVM